MPINQHPSLHTYLLHKSGGGGVEKTTSEFPGSPVVRTQCFHCQGPGSIPPQGIKILQAPSPQTKTKNPDLNCFICICNCKFHQSAMFLSSFNLIANTCMKCLPSYTYYFLNEEPENTEFIHVQ